MNSVCRLGAMIALLFCCATASAQKLDYKQQQALKDATYFLDQVEGICSAIDEKSANWKVGDSTVQIVDVKNLLANKDRAVQYMKNAGSRFDQLPGHDDVNAQIDRYNKLKDRVMAQEKKLIEIHNSLVNVVNQGAGAEYKTDFDRLREINQMYSDPQILQTQPQRAIDVIKQINAVKNERKRIAEKYAAMLNQDTTESRNMNGVLKYFDEVFGNFDRAAGQFAAEAPQRITADMDEAMTMAQGAVKENKPGFFGEDGGVQQRLNWAKTRLDILTAMQPESATVKDLNIKLAMAQDKAKSYAAELQQSIIQNNRVPNDQYNGPDKPELIEIVKAKWKNESGLSQEILSSGINSSGWQRDTRWEWMSNAWYKVDKSRIQGFVVIKLNDDLAAAYHVNLVKDHLALDKVTAYFFDDPKSEPIVQRKILMKNVK